MRGMQVTLLTHEEELLDEGGAALHLIRAAAGDEAITREDWNRLNRYKSSLGGSIQQYLVYHLTGKMHETDRAMDIWNEVLAHKRHLTKVLDRDPGVFVAAMDFLSNNAGEHLQCLRRHSTGG